MKIRLIEVTDELDLDVETGTCDLCYSYTDVSYELYGFEDEWGNTKHIDSYVVDYGDIIALPSINNIIRFAEWLKDQDVDIPNIKHLSFNHLYRLIDHFNEQDK